MMINDGKYIAVHNLDEYGCPTFDGKSLGIHSFPPRSFPCIFGRHVSNSCCAQYKCIMYFEFLLSKHGNDGKVKSSSPEDMFTNNPRRTCYEISAAKRSKNCC
jgi:hypothetical protein